MVMHLGRKNMKFQYVMDKRVLQEVTEEKHLGAISNWQDSVMKHILKPVKALE